MEKLKKNKAKNLSEPILKKKNLSPRIAIPIKSNGKGKQKSMSNYFSVKNSKIGGPYHSSSKSIPISLHSVKSSIDFKSDIHLPLTRKSLSSPKKALSNSQSNRLITKSNPKKALSSRMALIYFKLELSEYEKTEILQYSEVFYLGDINNKINTYLKENNYGYDDENGDYLLIKGDHIAYRYECIKMLGKGNFGQVVLCEDHKTHSKVAVKIIKNKKKFSKQAIIEIKILQTLRENDQNSDNHAVKLKNYFIFRNHVCIVFDELSMNLFELLCKNKFQGFSLKLLHKFVYQILQCLEFTYRYKIVHCDLKPENIMLVSRDKAEINVIDFGSSCFESERFYTYIQSRFYRAPEILLGIPYTTAIDMWSLGCIVFEFYTGNALFTGESEHHQFLNFVEVLGLPPESVLKKASRLKVFFDSSGYLKSVFEGNSMKFVVPATKNIEELMKNAPPNLIEFVKACLDWDSDTRMKPDQALKHPWILNKS